MIYSHPLLSFMGEKTEAQRGKAVCPSAFHSMGLTLSVEVRGAQILFLAPPLTVFLIEMRDL